MEDKETLDEEAICNPECWRSGAVPFRDRFRSGRHQSNDPAQREQEYIAALKKCDPLTGADKQKCIEAAKKKFGQM